MTSDNKDGKIIQPGSLSEYWDRRAQEGGIISCGECFKRNMKPSYFIILGNKMTCANCAHVYEYERE